MRMPLDDAQVMRHTFAQVAEQCAMLAEELGKVGISGSLSDEIVASYFSLFMGPILAPDPAAILKEIFPKEGE